MSEKPDPDLYPVHVECPGCRERKKVVIWNEPAGWQARIEQHDIGETQCTSDGHKWCRITRPCPAALAIVSPWEPSRRS